jgi:16S rRNA (cytosine1402-N4)-methyltransferase
VITTAHLARIVGATVAPKYRNKTLARVWQAVRFKLNRELEELREGLERMYPLMRKGGSMVVISYESLMDRMVKRFFRGLTPAYQKDAEVEPTGFGFEIMTRKVLRPSEEEVQRNSRSRSARLRCALKM